MPTARDIRWLKGQFSAQIADAVAGTPFDVDMICALACQETGDIWGPLSRKGLTATQILPLCVGDVITAPRRKAFPKTRAELLAWPRGGEMYALAREGLADMATQITSYAPYVGNPERFCHAFGILQYDLQHFKDRPDYFLNGDYADLGKCVALAVEELKTAQAGIGSLKGKATLTDRELASVAIAYNRGSYNPLLGLKQGYKNSDGKFYGELFFDFLQLARSVVLPVTPDAPPATYVVRTDGGSLLLRSGAVRDPTNVIGRLKNGDTVRGLGEPPVAGYLHVVATIDGREVRGFAGQDFLVSHTEPDPVG